MKVAVVTPYYKESVAVLRQCHRSVVNQTFACTHILVADGHPKTIFAASPRTEHVVLPRANGDNGNMPRYIGSILAQSWGFDAVAYLDADNWYAPDHIERLAQAHRATNRPVVACKRSFHDKDGNRLVMTEWDEDTNLHVDTSCFFVTKAAFSAFATWRMPKQLGPICDRIFLQGLARNNLGVSFTDARTVAFRSQYLSHYAFAKRTPPPGAKADDEFEGAVKFLRDDRNKRALLDSIGFVPTIGM